MKAQGLFVSTEAFATKELDGVVETIGDAVIHAATGVPARVVLVTDYSAGADGFITNQQFGSPAELRGKRLGVGVGTFSQLFALTVLEKYGLKESDVYFVNVDAEDVPAALENGQIDAHVCWKNDRRTCAGCYKPGKWRSTFGRIARTRQMRS